MKFFKLICMLIPLIYSFEYRSEDKSYTAYIFMGLECPISQKYIPTLNEMADSQTDLAIIGVFSGAVIDQEIAEFKARFGVEFELVSDVHYKLADRYKASVTPEVFLIDASGALRYSGAIDNWFVSLGRNRFKPSKFYLLDALAAIRKGNEVDPDRTLPIGCFLERNKAMSHEHH